MMKKILITETQFKKIISELKLSGIVAEFLDKISEFEDLEGMAKSMGFKNYMAMIEFIRDNGYSDFIEIERKAENYIQNYPEQKYVPVEDNSLFNYLFKRKKKK